MESLERLYREPESWSSLWRFQSASHNLSVQCQRVNYVAENVGNKSGQDNILCLRPIQNYPERTRQSIPIPRHEESIKFIFKGVLKNLKICILMYFAFTHVPCDSACLSLHVWPLRIRPLHHAQPQRGRRSSEPWSCAEVYFELTAILAIKRKSLGVLNFQWPEESNALWVIKCCIQIILPVRAAAQDLLKIASKHITGCWQRHDGCRLARTRGKKTGRKQKHKEFNVQMAFLSGHCKHYYSTKQLQPRPLTIPWTRNQGTRPAKKVLWAWLHCE